MGRLTLRGYAEEFGYHLGELLGILADQGMEVDPDARFGTVAGDLGITPGEVIDALNRGG